MMGHPDLHRVLKDLVKADAGGEYCECLSKVIVKHFDECLKTRACWIILAFLEHDSTKDMILESVSKKQMLLKIKELKSDGGGKGLQLLQEKLKK